MAVSSSPVSYEMSDYSGVIRRRWWIVLLAACIGLAAAGLYVAAGHKTYSASALVQVNALPSNTGSSTGSNATGARTAGSVNMDNQAQLVQSAIVAALANKQLHSSLTLPMLIKQTSVAVPPNTTFLQIGCKESTATGAANCANDFANAYLTYAYGNSVSAANQTLRTLSAEIAKLTGQIRGLEDPARHSPRQSDEADLHTVALAVDNIAVDGLENQLEHGQCSELAALTSGAAGNVASPATLPTSPISPRATLFLPSGLVAGLVIGLLLAFVVDRRDKRIHSSRDLERFFGVPALLNSVRRSAPLERLIVPAGSEPGRAFAELAQAVAASFSDDEHFLLVAGTSPGNCSGIVAANVAATLARSRSEVVLVCAGSESSLLSRLLATGDGPGLSEVLAGQATLSEAARRVTGFPWLRVIAPGRGRAGSTSRTRTKRPAFSWQSWAHKRTTSSSRSSPLPTTQPLSRWQSSPTAQSLPSRSIAPRDTRWRTAFRGSSGCRSLCSGRQSFRGVVAVS